jgi:hypothetical protein
VPLRLVGSEMCIRDRDETVIELENAMRSGDLKNIEATASKIWQSPLLPKDANLN